MSSPSRFVIEGTWSGYVSRQERVVHRRVKKKWYADQAAKVSAIRFSDGTTLQIQVRPAMLREKVPEIRGYDRIMDGAVFGKMEGFIDVERIKI